METEKMWSSLVDDGEVTPRYRNIVSTRSHGASKATDCPEAAIPAGNLQLQGCMNLESPEYLGRLSSPEYDFGGNTAAIKCAPLRQRSPARQFQVRVRDAIAFRGEAGGFQTLALASESSLGPTPPPLNLNQREHMSFDSSPPPPVPSKDNTYTMLPSSPPAVVQIHQESSDDDIPIMSQRRPLKRTNSVPPRERERRNTGDVNYREHPAASKTASTKPAAKKTGKPYKKSRPQPWASKPIMKNDMVAKKAVIREIESYWGKGFTRSYIPKCHRPLVKRGADGKRAMYRAHETDPKKWLPSVLKAILMIAKLTTNKKWLKDAMNDVVRYRIKNTGNRKPQLVTTDFDVIEDMLVKDWAVDYAFEIRYKHLLVNRKDQQETDEDIDHILQVEDDGDEGSDDQVDEDDEMNDQEEGVDVDEDDDEEFEQGYDEISDNYQMSSGYTKAPTPRQHVKQEKPSKSSRIKSEPVSSPPPRERFRPEQSPYMHGTPMPGYGGPAMSPWGIPMPPPYGGFGGFPGYRGFPGYGQAPYPGAQYPGRGSRQGSQRPGGHGMYPPPPHPMSPMPGNPYQQPSPFGNNFMGHGDYGTSGPDHRSQTPSVTRQGSMHPKIKRESPGFDDVVTSVGEFNDPQDSTGVAMNDGDEDVDAELEAAELELKLARLRAKKAAQKKAR
ncbi:hypothetical protein J1614_003655 [Plenodomus biglobosus]|nr:hypothetical protein J1614_003655 [Plenodomus biglobosus]